MAATKKSENKTVSEKAVKVLSPKKQIEAVHLMGKHPENQGVQPDCGFCKRRLARLGKKESATKRFFAAKK